MGTFLGALADGVRGVVDPCPAANGARGEWTEAVQNGAVAAGQLRSGDVVDFVDEAVGALLAFGGEVAVGQVVTVQALVAANVGGGQRPKAGDVEVGPPCVPRWGRALWKI